MVILRPDTVGKTTSAYAGYEDPALLKITTYVGHAQTGTSILGIFNCTSRPLSELIPLSSFSGTETGKYIIRSFTSNRITKPVSSDDKAALVHVSLSPGTWEILTASPIHDYKIKNQQQIQISCLGLLGKMTGAAAIVSNEVQIDNGRFRYKVHSKALGVLGFWIDGLEEKWKVDDNILVVIFGKQIPKHCVKAKKGVLEIDVERAWNETKQQPGWGDEVEVEVIIS